MNKNTNKLLLRTLLIGVFTILSMPATAAVESTDPIKLTIHDWTGQYLTTHIMGEVLKKAGYNIEYVQADYIAQFAGLE
jgi:glycine betaine/proline transport system substrate-binding protein